MPFSSNRCVVIRERTAGARTRQYPAGGNPSELQAAAQPGDKHESDQKPFCTPADDQRYEDIGRVRRNRHESGQDDSPQNIQNNYGKLSDSQVIAALDSNKKLQKAMEHTYHEGQALWQGQRGHEEASQNWLRNTTKIAENCCCCEKEVARCMCVCVCESLHA